MNKLKKDLQAVLKQMKTVSKKVENLLKGEGGRKKAPAKKKAAARKKSAAKKRAPARKKIAKETAFSKVISLISRSKKGVNTSQIKANTGFDDKKIANIIFKAKNRGLIKSISKGVYKKGR